MSAEEVMALVGGKLLSGELPEMGALASETRVGRTTLFRWFGDRENLIATVMATYLEGRLEQGYQLATGTGGARIGEAIESLLVNSATEPFLRLLREHPETMLKIITSPHGKVQKSSIASLAHLIELERETQKYEPLFDAESLAFILVQIGQAFMWARASTGAPPDIEETMRATKALLDYSRETDSR